MKTELLRARIKQMRLTQKSVARSLGISENTMCRKLKTGLFRSDELAILVRLLELENPEDYFFAAEGQ